VDGRCVQEDTEVSGTRLGVARIWARTTAKRRWPSLLALALLVAVLGATAMGSLAAARRTQSAFPDYLAASRASDVQLFLYDFSSASGAGGTSAAATLAALPGVAHVSTSPVAFLEPEGLDAKDASAVSQAVQFVGSLGGASFRYDRPAVVAGRMANPASATEFVASRDAAHLLGWRVGQRIGFGLYSLRETLHARSFPPSEPPAAHVTLRLVGLVAFANEVAHDDVDRYPTYAVMTPAFTHEHRSDVGYQEYDLLLRHGAADVPAVERSLIRNLPPGSIYAVHLTSIVEGEVERAIRPESIALAALGVIAAAAALVLAGQALRREIGARRSELLVARALGADRATLLTSAVAAPLVAVVAGAAGAVALAYAVSPLAPVGIVRLADEDPGWHFDAPVLLLGAAAVLVVLSALGAGFAASLVRGLSRASSATTRRSSVAAAAQRAGLPVPAVAGLRFAFERGGGRTAAPVRAAFLAAVVAVAVAATSSTFASSLATLTSHPALYGWDWQGAILSPAGNNVAPVTRTLLAHDPLVASFTGFGFGDIQVDGQTVPALLAGAHPSFGPPVLSGHGFTGRAQTVLGQETAAQLHVHVGSIVTASYGTPADFPIYVPPTRLRVVGIATMPAIGAPGNLHTSMGVGIELGGNVEPAAFQHATSQADPNLNGPNVVAVRFKPGVSTAAGMASLHGVVAATQRALARDPEAASETFVAVGPQRPAEIVAYESSGLAPSLLAVGLAVGATAALALALVASVRRRRRDLALLKTLGCSTGQLAGTVAAQSSAVAVVGVLFGVPLGIALGRWLWIRFAETIAAVPQPTVPGLELFVIGVVAVVLANVVAALPGWLASRTPVALVLRSE
jgi:hypothetical protein